ncbi:YifB family Mg chelatase-like AAA ATPase [Leifsonia poae]|uniref:YifB family Mg chelatase-like AAA ATPase n=1 Tax=Leifsonia poae TaxID=110933 RepID=UPI001CBDAA41|nr:YifB family Mg chelatase-like AAA ATPase [Leifsonia poae]
MSLARTFAVALTGLHGDIVEVEADIAAGLPAFVLIGLPDLALGESRKRVVAAAVNAGCPLTQRKLTVNLSPAALRKQGSAFDLAIAVAALAAAGDIAAESVARVVHLGELGLDGRLRAVPGILPAVAAARTAGFDRVMVPAASEVEARLVEGIEVTAVASLRAAAIWHGGDLQPDAVEPAPLFRSSASEPDDDAVDLDMADVVGNDEVVDALVVAAAGGHHVSMVGPPGAGKTMLAARLPTILPDLTDEQALEVTSIRSLTGSWIGGELARRPPFEAPHHTASPASLVGGGSGRIVPGAIVRASHGVLFLDEAAEFPGRVLDALRQPLESGSITIHRANGRATFPARFQLVLASNPCPCGRYGSVDDECTCTPIARRRYFGRISGPLLDRVDIRLTLRRLGLAALRGANSRSETLPPGQSSLDLRHRVVQARCVAAERLSGTPWRRNADVPGQWLRSAGRRLAPSTLAVLDRALERGSITMRGYDRTLRLAWTLADLDTAASPGAHHIGAALFLRRG